MDVFNNIAEFTMSDLVEFHNENMSGKDYTILVLGNKDDLNLKALENYGEVKFLSLEDVFGY